MRFTRRELAGAVADLGVLVPIAVALIVKNGLSPTAVLLPAGLLYLLVAAVYRLPVPVQPLKALGAIAIAKGLGSNSIAAAALIIGATFLVLGRLRLLDFAARAFPRALIRGVQLVVGLLFLKIAWKLVSDTPKSFVDHVHGAGGMTAHVKFGARTAAAPVAIGTGLVVLAVVVGSGLAALLGAFPVAILAGLLATAGLLHIALLRDLHGVRDWALALMVGI